MDAIVLAGGKATPGDPLFEMAHGGLKSMIMIAGKPMVQWVLDALSGAKSIDCVVLIGIEDVASLTCSKRMFTLADSGVLIKNIQNGAAFLQELHPDEVNLVSISADIPAVTSEIIDQSVHVFQEAKYDIYYSVVEREVMEKRYPGSRRTYIKMKDGEICGGDLNSFNKKAALNPAGLWTKIIETRKNPLKQAAMIGWGTLALILLGKLTLEEGASRVCRRMGITGKVLRTPFAEIGMDVDKPFQFEIVEKDLMR